MTITFRCKNCGTYNDAWQPECPQCDLPGLFPLEYYAEGWDIDGSIKAAPKTLADAIKPKHVRVKTGIGGLDKVLGGGFRVPSVVMFGGAPGSGKSSLLLKFIATTKERKTLYINTEETPEDVRERAERFGLADKLHLIRAVATESLAEAMEYIRAEDPRIVVLDSINKIRDEENDTRDKMANLVAHSKAFIRESREHNRVFVFVSHLNKEQEIVGVQEVQHDVDVVMMLKKVAHSRRARTLMCPDKNRYGDTSERATFHMLPTGLMEVEDPEEDATDRSDSAAPAKANRLGRGRRAAGHSAR